MLNARQPNNDVDALHRQIAVMADEIQRLKEQLHLATRKQFEAFSPDQGLLFTTDDVEIVTTEDGEIVEREEKPNRKKSPTRQSVMIKKGIPVERRVLDLEESDKHCDGCGCELHKVGEDCSYQLEYIPAQTKVIETARPKYGCRACETGIKQAPVPASPIPRSMATPSLLSYLIVSKSTIKPHRAYDGAARYPTAPQHTVRLVDGLRQAVKAPSGGHAARVVAIAPGVHRRHHPAFAK